jgi:hypothetical protein
MSDSVSSKDQVFGRNFLQDLQPSHGLEKKEGNISAEALFYLILE